MPGPMSAPNGERRLVLFGEERRKLEAKRGLNTGKTKKMKLKKGVK